MLISLMIAVLSQPNIALKIGFMIASSMFIGGMLVDSWKNLRMITFVLVIFIVFQLWIHDTILDTTNLVIVLNHVEVSFLNIIMSIAIVVLWIGGMALGMFIVRKTKEPFELQRISLQNELDALYARQSLVDLQELVEDIKKKDPTIPRPPIRDNAPDSPKPSDTNS
jgi:hypothetical protein